MTDKLQHLSDRISGWAIAALIALGIWVFMDQGESTRATTDRLETAVSKNTAATTELSKQVAVLWEKVENLEGGP